MTLPPIVVSPVVRRVLAGIAFLGCAAALAYHVRSYMPFFVDDAFISLRYSARLLHGQGLTWNDGERVEGYSNFLWVVAVAAGGLVHPELVLVARVLSCACVTGVLALLFASGLRRAGVGAVFFACVAALAVALCGPMAAWSIGGLEQAMLAVLLMAAAFHSEALHTSELAPPAAALPMSLALGLLCLVRPDGAIFSVAAVVALLCARRPSRATFKLACALVALPIAFTLAQLAFRKLYYGDFLPNTYRAKGAFSWARVEQGRLYVQESLKPFAALWAAGALTLLVSAFDRLARRRALFALCSIALWVGYVVRIGGDIFPQRRHLVGVFVLLALLALIFLQWLWERRAAVRFAAWLLGPALLASLYLAQQGDPLRQRALDDRWHWSGQPIGIFLRKMFLAQRPLLAVDAAGAMPYYYELPCLDMLGLNDRHIAEHPPAGIGTGYIGHELGDGRYVLSRKPDLVAFWTPVGGDRPQWRSGHEMVAQPEFHRFYQAVTFETDDPTHTRTRLWVRRSDGRIGMQRRGDRIEVPAYLMQGADEVVRVGRSGTLCKTVPAHGALKLVDVNLEPGRWQVTVAADRPVTVSVLTGVAHLPMDSNATFVLQGTGSSTRRIEVELQAEDAATQVSGLTLERRVEQ